MHSSTLSIALYFMYAVTAIFLAVAAFKIYAIFSILKTKKSRGSLDSTIESAPEENSKIDIQSIYLEILELRKELKNRNIPPRDSISQSTHQNVTDGQNIRLRRVK